jgi:hypothetical protein
VTCFRFIPGSGTLKQTPFDDAAVALYLLIYESIQEIFNGLCNQFMWVTMKPIKNAAWTKVIRSRDNAGYGLTEYSFTITEANLK